MVEKPKRSAVVSGIQEMIELGEEILGWCQSGCSRTVVGIEACRDLRPKLLKKFLPTKSRALLKDFVFKVSENDVVIGKLFSSAKAAFPFSFQLMLRISSHMAFLLIFLRIL